MKKLLFIACIIIGVSGILVGLASLYSTLDYFSDYNFSTKQIHREELNGLISFGIIGLVILISGLGCFWGGLRIKRRIKGYAPNTT